MINVRIGTEIDKQKITDTYSYVKNVSSHRLWIKNRFSISPVKMPDDTITGSFVSCVL